jgi:hypothetical protein
MDLIISVEKYNYKKFKIKLFLTIYNIRTIDRGVNFVPQQCYILDPLPLLKVFLIELLEIQELLARSKESLAV